MSPSPNRSATHYFDIYRYRYIEHHTTRVCRVLFLCLCALAAIQNFYRYPLLTFHTQSSPTRHDTAVFSSLPPKCSRSPRVLLFFLPRRRPRRRRRRRQNEPIMCRPCRLVFLRAGERRFASLRASLTARAPPSARRRERRLRRRVSGDDTPTSTHRPRGMSPTAPTTTTRRRLSWRDAIDDVRVLCVTGSLRVRVRVRVRARGCWCWCCSRD